jgi:methylenetetrahydrofolate reductase (NADPH)
MNDLPQIPQSCLTGDDIAVSFEFFPPRNPQAGEQFWRALGRLELLGPRFASVTSGALGSSRAATRETVLRMRQVSRLEPAAHVTCMGASAAEIEVLASDYWQAGIRHIVAIRGDMPVGELAPHPRRGGLARAADLVTCLKRVADFDISVAAFPETHPEAISPAADLDNLKRKFDAGATRAITQFFFDVPLFLDFVERCRKAGIDQEIVPGILPVTNFGQMAIFARRCGASVPDWLARLFDGLDGDPATRELIAATVAAEQCTSLKAHGVRAFHFYTLNRANLTTAVCRLLGLQGRPALDAPALSSAMSIENGARAALERLMARQRGPVEVSRV